MSRVTIFNRNDGDASHTSLVSGRLSNSVVSLLDDKNTTLNEYIIGNATDISRFDFSFTRILVLLGPWWLYSMGRTKAQFLSRSFLLLHSFLPWLY